MFKLFISIFLMLAVLTFCSSPPPLQKPVQITGSNKVKEREKVRVQLDLVNKPKLLVIAKSIDNLDELTEVAINEINKKLGDLGFYYVSHNAVMGFMQKMNNYGQGQSYRDIAIKSNTPYYITIFLKVNEMGKGVNNSYFSSVNISAEAFSTETAQGVGSSNQSSGQTGSKTSQNEANIFAAQEAAQKIADDLIQQILNHFKRQDNYGFQFEIKIFGIEDYLIAREFRDALKNYPGFMGNIRISKTEDYYKFEITFKDKHTDEVIDAVFDALTGNTNFRTLNLQSSEGKLINFIIQ